MYRFVSVIDQMGKSSFGLVGSALAFHAGGPGSIPGRGALVYFRFNLVIIGGREGALPIPGSVTLLREIPNT